MSAKTEGVSLRRFRWPQWRVAQFVARRGFKASIGWAAVFGGFTVINVIGYDKTYGAQGAAQLAQSLGSNVGLTMLLGEPLRIDAVTGFTDWRVLGTVSLIGSIWALLYATRTFRGEEGAGRWELFLAGQTTARRAAINALLGVGFNLVVIFAIVAVLVAGVARNQEPGLGIAGSISYSLVVTCIVTIFMSVGALASQIMSTRGRAAALSAAVFGVFFLLRGIADSSTATWLRNVTPFGWLEKIHPLTENNTFWFLPVFGLVLIFVLATVYLAGKRDMGSSLIADKDSARPRLALLDLPFTIAFRLTRATTLGWLAEITLVATLLGSLAKASGEAIAASGAAEQIFSRISSSAQVVGTRTFLGMALFMCMMLIMLYVASAVTSVRNDEAEGYLDNLLVRPVRRSGWLWGRIALIGLGIMTAALLAGVAAWAGAATQQSGVGYSDLFVASLNAMAPALCLLGFGTLVFGFLPRLTPAFSYGLVAWSFILQMVGSILGLNHWLLDLSVLHHASLAPAVDPNWTSAGALAGLGVLGCVLGVLRFQRRDLQNE